MLTLRFTSIRSFKLFHRTVLISLMGAVMMCSPGAQAQFVTTPAQRAEAAAIVQSGIPESELIGNAPERYTVKRGDTLWAISGLYLKTPWKWPALWGMNQNEIRNPHLIYPGQVLVLTRSGGRARLGLSDGVEGMPEQKLLPSLPDQKLSPRVRSEPLPPTAIASINLGNLKHFLSQPLVVDEAGIQNSGYVLTGPESRVFSAKGDTFYARGLGDSGLGNKHQLYRPGKPLRDPDTGLVIAYEAFYLGVAEVLKAGDPAQLKITESKEEITRGDRLIPFVREPELTATPRAPEKPIKARVMSSYNGVEFAGSNMVVTLNKGRSAGLEVGHVLAVWRTGDRVVDNEIQPQGFWAKLKNEKTIVQLPDEQYGQVIVFRVFDNVAYALVVGTTLPVKVGDIVTQP
jgi:LysM repeat protein